MYSLAQLSEKCPIGKDEEIPLPAKTTKEHTTFSQLMVNNYYWCIILENGSDVYLK